MSKIHTFGNTRHDIIALSHVPGEVLGVDEVKMKGYIHPARMEAFEFLAEAETREFPRGGWIEVLELGGWLNARAGEFNSTLRAIDVRLAPGAVLTGPMCVRDVRNEEDATPELPRPKVGDQYILPILGVISALAAFVFLGTGYGLGVGIFAGLFLYFAVQEQREKGLTGRIAGHRRFQVLGPARKSWN